MYEPDIADLRLALRKSSPDHDDCLDEYVDPSPIVQKVMLWVITNSAQV